MRTHRLICIACLILLVHVSTVASDIPTGMEDIYNIKIEQHFHPFWPPIIGNSILGTIVIVKKPGKLPDALYETIESPEYRNAGFKGAFEIGQPIDVVPAGNFVEVKTIGADIAFKQLDALSSADKKGPTSNSLTGSDPKQSTTSSSNCPVAAICGCDYSICI